MYTYLQITIKINVNVDSKCNNDGEARAVWCDLNWRAVLHFLWSTGGQRQCATGFSFLTPLLHHHLSRPLLEDGVWLDDLGASAAPATAIPSAAPVRILPLAPLSALGFRPAGAKPISLTVRFVMSQWIKEWSRKMSQRHCPINLLFFNFATNDIWGECFLHDKQTGYVSMSTNIWH